MLSPLLALALVQAQPTVIEGNWGNPNGSVIIAIAPCGEALCGTVQWASEKAKADARRGGTDPLIGAQLLSGLAPKGAGHWNGRLLVPDLNKRSRVALHQMKPDQLKITGCAVGRLLCKSQLWRRVEAARAP